VLFEIVLKFYILVEETYVSKIECNKLIKIKKESDKK